MRKAARAIIIEDGKLLLVRRDRESSQYYTLVGGVIDDGESAEQTLAREVREETGLTVTSARMVYVEQHPEPYNEQYIFLCDVAPHGDVAIQIDSEEAMLNKLGFNTHTLVWVNWEALPRLPFLTPRLGEAISKAYKHGFPDAAEVI